MIAYKIIRKNGRKSGFVANDENNSKYIKTYIKGKTVICKKESVGIFCFEFKADAEQYMGNDFALKIIKVEGVNQMPLPTSIPYCQGVFRYYHGLFHPSQMPPNGTILFQKVKVLE